MNAVVQLEELVEVAEKLGYQIRYDYFGGTGGGTCEFGGRQWLFIDLALSAREQAELVASVLANDPLYQTLEVETVVQQAVKEAA